MKRFLLLLLALMLIAAPLTMSACQQTTAEPPAEEGEEAGNGTGEQPPSTDETGGETDDPVVENAHPLDTNKDGTVAILAFGNSFSVNAFKFLHPILVSQGVENLILGNLYYGGCTLEKTAALVGEDGMYTNYYRYDLDGTRTDIKNCQVGYAMEDAAWDVFTMQQASGSSGFASSFTPFMEEVLDYIETHTANENYKVYWHMTWAYQQNSTHNHFPRYGSDQMKMYNAIINATKEKIVGNESFAGVIPAGTAIQNARTSSFGDTMTTDGYHLNERACLIAGYTWATALLGQELNDTPYVPDSASFTKEYVDMAVAAANATVASPFAVTSIG